MDKEKISSRSYEKSSRSYAREHSEKRQEDNDGLVLSLGNYDPIKVGSIDGTDEKPHDRGLIRALLSTYSMNKSAAKSDPHYTLFVGRLNYETDESTLEKIFAKFGRLKSMRLVRDIVTGHSKGYAFVEYKHRSDAKRAHDQMCRYVIDNNEVIVEFEHERRVKNWKPRRLGGGLGGFKQSGQLRFGGRYRPFVRYFNRRS
jgi:U11/U12 small nuclear ribonucleoprotein SNRNP35